MVVQPDFLPTPPDLNAIADSPRIVAVAIAAKLRALPGVPIEPGGDFDRAMRAQLAKIEQALG